MTPASKRPTERPPEPSVGCAARKSRIRYGGRGVRAGFTGGFRHEFDMIKGFDHELADLARAASSGPVR